METYEVERDDEGRERIRLPLRGRALLSHNMYNRGTAFTLEERKALGIEGLLPAGFSSIEQQVARTLEHILLKTDPLERFIGLAALERRNALLFYRVLVENFEELMPIVYTPTVGLACERFSHTFRQGRGLWITPGHKGRIAEVLGHAPWRDVRLIVATDNERILGLGDQGAGGMWIPVGKLSLYIAGAGFHPTQTLPISLDVGTDNRELLEDDLYLGWREPRLRGREYDELLEEFVTAVKDCFPGALLQWEDFKKGNAFALLDRYRHRLTSFNDDIQGTAAVAVAGIMAASRVSGIPLGGQRVVMVGSGAAGVGIARLLRGALEREGLAGDELLGAVAMLDSGGLLVEGRDLRDEYKRDFVWNHRVAAHYGLDVGEPVDLHRCVGAVQPTVLIGTSGQAGIFDRELVQLMAAHCDRPAIFPFSNPTSQSEATPAQLVEWTEGRALIATGSPFEAVEWQGNLIQTGQGNNVYVFPGVGLGALVSGAREVTDVMFAAAADTLASLVTEEDLAVGRLYPRLARLRDISRQVAMAVGRTAIDAGLATVEDEADLERRLDDFIWKPSYPQVNLDPPATD